MWEILLQSASVIAKCDSYYKVRRNHGSEILFFQETTMEIKRLNCFFLCNPYHQLLAIKDIISFFLVFYILLKHFIVKLYDGKIYKLCARSLFRKINLRKEICASYWLYHGKKISLCSKKCPRCQHRRKNSKVKCKFTSW